MEFYSPKQDELMHHGVKGMKWGVRRNRAQLAKERGHRATKRASRSSEPEREAPRKTVRDMSDDDLRKAISRLQMERQYAELTKPAQKQKLFDGKKFVADVLTQQGKKLAGDIINYQAGKLINKAMGAQVVNLKGDDKKKDD